MKLGLSRCVILLAVIGSALVCLGQVSPDVEQGMKPYGSYHGGAIDQVGLNNQNLFLHAPLMAYSQRGGELAYPIVLKYNNKSFSLFVPTCPQGVKPGQGACPLRMVFNPNPFGNNGVSHGNSVTAGFEGFAGSGASKVNTGLMFNQQPVFVNSFSVVTPDGSTHQSVPTDSGSATTDGSGFSGLVDSNGTLSFGAAEDRNGNQIGVPSPGVWTDTLGRQIPVAPTPSRPPAATNPSTADLGTCPALNYGNQAVTFAYTWSLPTVNGGTLPLILCYADVYVRTNFMGATSVANGFGFEVSKSFPMLQSVVFPDNTYWAFQYDAADPNNTSSFGFGDLLKVTFPTGGSITYTWEMWTPCSFSYSRGVQTRTVDANDGTGPHTWRYSPGIVTDPAGNDTVHTFTGLGGTCSLYETQTQFYQGSHTGGTLLKTVNTDYSFTPNPWDPQLISLSGEPPDSVTNVLPIRVTTILPNGQTSKVETDHDAGFIYHGPLDGITTNQWTCYEIIPGDPTSTTCSYTDFQTYPVTNYTASYGKAIATREYDWGTNAPGPLLRQTLTTYQWQVSSAYLTANLLNLPATVKVLDGAGHLCAETDYFYDEAGYLTTPSPAITTQHTTAPWTVRGNLTTVTHQLSSTPCAANATWTSISSHSTWYDTGEVQSSTDPLGHTTTHFYDSAYAGAYPTKTCNAKSQCVSGTYDFNTGLLTSLTNANATLQASGNTPGDAAHTTTFNYDNRWRTTSLVSPPDPFLGLNPETDFDYSILNQVKRARKVDGGTSIKDYAYVDGVGRTKQTRLVDPAGDDLVDITYDAVGQTTTASNSHRSTPSTTDGVTQTQYDALGRVTHVTKQDGSVVSMDYSAGSCTSVTDEAGNPHKSCSDALGRLVEVDEPGPGINAGGTPGTGTITISGSLASSTGSGTKATGSFTGAGPGLCYRPWICTDQCVKGPLTCDSGSVSLTVNGVTATAPYNKNSTAQGILSSLANQLNPHPTTFSDPGTGTINLTADQSGPNYSMSSSAVTNNPTYFSDPSVLIEVSGPALTGGVNPATVYDSGTLTVTVNGFQASAVYNQNLNNTPQLMANALASALNAAGSPVTALASGNTITITAQGVGTAMNYTVTGGSSTSFTASGTTLSGGTDPGGIYAPYKTLYAYDTLGNLLRVDQKGSAPADSSKWRTRLFTYNSLSQLLTANNPESGIINYSYDADGNLLQKISPAPNQIGPVTTTISFCYDELHRLKGKGYGAQSCPLTTPVVTYAYDAGTDGKGHLTSLTDQAGSGSYSYDNMDRIFSEQRTIAGISKTMSYDYNLDGSVKTVHYPNGAAVTYTPDSAGRTLSAVDNGNGISYVTGAIYGPDGAITGFINGNTGSFAGITNAFSYNKRLQPINMSASSPSQTVFSLGYDFHVGNGASGTDNGNVWGITNYKDSSRSQSFTYDQLNRLASAQNTGADCAQMVIGGKTKFWGNAYGYDSWGNLLSKTVTKCGAENLAMSADAHNQIHSISGADYQFDAAGNMTFNATPPAATYTYDQENRITGAGGFAYTYDGDGNRVKKTDGTTGTLYWYMALGIVGESDLTGTMKSEYVFFGGERVARRDLVAPTGVFYYFSDHLKTTDIVTDAQGNIRNESDFYPWGGELQFLANDSNHYKFTGKERDSESGLDYFGARYYSNGLGRFITPDWAAKAVAVAYADFSDPQTLNLYSYVRNVPTTRYDADGHEPQQDDRKPPLSGMVPQPKVGEVVEVKAGVCLCMSDSVNAGPVETHGKVELIGAEIKSNLAGDVETKLSSKSGISASAGPLSGKIEGGAELSSTNGASAVGKATLNGVGVKVNENGVSPVVEKTTGDMKVGGYLGAGLKVGAALNLSKIGEIYNALKTNVPIVVGAALNQMMPGAGTAMGIGQRPPAASSLGDLPRSMVGNPIP